MYTHVQDIIYNLTVSWSFLKLRDPVWEVPQSDFCGEFFSHFSDSSLFYFCVNHFLRIKNGLPCLSLIYIHLCKHTYTHTPKWVGVGTDIFWEWTTCLSGGTGQGSLWWVPIYICSSILSVCWAEYSINSWALKNQIPSSKQVEGFSISANKTYSYTKDFVLRLDDVENFLWWECFHPFLPHLPFLQGWVEEREGLEMWRPKYENFREQDLNISILDTSSCSDTSISCFWFLLLKMFMHSLLWNSDY